MCRGRVMLSGSMSSWQPVSSAVTRGSSWGWVCPISSLMIWRVAWAATSASSQKTLSWGERYKPPSTENNPTLEDPTPDYMNLLGMIFSMCGLMLKLKWCAWIAVYCSFISFANSRSSEDTKQMMSSFMLSISAVVMSYLQNPQPMSPPW
uniref:PAT complex subunit Asterix n=1 Tax=Gopherus agassizii TaxID=38772 RepID=A0A452ICF8_9SAUR